MGVQSPYTEAEIAAIGGWLADGLSATQIAAAFGARFRRHVSRNAIIGIVSRNRRLSAIGFAGKPRGGRKAGWQPSTPRRGESGRAAAKTARPSATREAGGGGAGRDGGAGAASKDPLSASPRPAPLPTMGGGADGRQVLLRPAPLPPASPAITFLEAMFSDRCLFFVDRWDAPAGPDMPVCGAARALAPAETRWCPYHQSRMTTAAYAAHAEPRRPAIAQWGRP